MAGFLGMVPCLGMVVLVPTRSARDAELGCTHYARACLGEGVKVYAIRLV